MIYKQSRTNDINNTSLIAILGRLSHRLVHKIYPSLFPLYNFSTLPKICKFGFATKGTDLQRVEKTIGRQQIVALMWRVAVIEKLAKSVTLL